MAELNAKKAIAEGEKKWYDRLKAEIKAEYPDAKPLTPEERNADLIEDDEEENIYDDEED